MKHISRIVRLMGTILIHLKLLIVNTLIGDKITICIAVYNRTDFLINRVINSLNKCFFRNHIVLSIFDCGTDDVNNLKEEIQKKWKGELIFTTEHRPFSRTYALNRAIKQASTDRIFCCDADMTLPKMLVLYYNTCVGNRIIWAPICFSLYKNKLPKICKDNGWWRSEGFGIIGILKKDIHYLGGFNENFTKWGGEDIDIVKKATRKALLIIRYKCYGLFHSWHSYGNWGGREEDQFEHSTKSTKYSICAKG